MSKYRRVHLPPMQRPRSALPEVLILGTSESFEEHDDPSLVEPYCAAIPAAFASVAAVTTSAADALVECLGGHDHLFDSHVRQALP